MTPDIFENAEVDAMFGADVFQHVHGEPEEVERSGWTVWMPSAAVRATVALATVGTLVLTPAVHNYAAAAPATHVQFAYNLQSPKLTASQKARIAHAQERASPRAHPDQGFEEHDFV